MRNARWTTRAGLTTLVVATFLNGCTDEKIVFRDRAPFNQPDAAAAGFLGYYDAATKQTTCGNCHAGFQGSWQGTAHASAYTTLNSSTAAADFCYACHTVTGKGNVASGTTAGHDAIKEATYYDVQCESCHGPGLEHVEGVGQGSLVRPLAKLSMTGTGNCGDCHSGTHQPYAEEWAASRHANVSASRAANASCAGCHDGRKALAKWGVDDNYIERDDPTAYQATTCAVCHDPHAKNNPGQLRFAVTAADPEENLCIRCHLRVGEPTVSTSSPHAPQGAMLLGFAGWRPPGFTYDTARIFGSHATTANPKLCAGCHVAKFTVTDQLTGAFSFQATGHLMRPVPCLDADGKPIADKTCAYTATARSWQTCTTAGCHANASVAATIFNDSRALMKSFTDQLWLDSNANGSMQASPTDAGLLPTVRASTPTEWSNSDNTITPAEGAEFNARLCGEYGQSTADNSKGVHNPFLCRALMIATIDYIRSYYGLPASAAEQARLDGLNKEAFYSAMHVVRTPSGR
ncbi:MAG: cytochrome c3 family protein [Gemmatimonadaceae bacterium]